MNSQNLANSLISWYSTNSRNLPWRETRDPYKIWLSEIILQQTRVKQGLPYYLNFSKNFPTLESLASATESEVLRLWQGLGYYSRARNLHKCARILVQNYHGEFPDSYEGLLKLPGIGPYTAAAIASFAFRHKVPAIDGNALRVYSRLLGIAEDISKSSTSAKIFKRASEVISETDPDLFNQAIMELGATVCQPTSPDCESCPLSSSCYAFQNGKQNELPVKSNKVKIRTRYFNYFIFRKNGSIALFERKENDIWKGLFDFYLIEDTSLLEPYKVSDKLIIQSLSDGANIDIVGTDVRHVLSHQHIYARFFEIHLANNRIMEGGPESASLNFYSKNEVLDLPKPVLVNNFLANYLFDERISY